VLVINCQRNILSCSLHARAKRKTSRRSPRSPSRVGGGYPLHIHHSPRPRSSDHTGTFFFPLRALTRTISNTAYLVNRRRHEGLASTSAVSDPYSRWSARNTGADRRHVYLRRVVVVAGLDSAAAIESAPHGIPAATLIIIDQRGYLTWPIRTVRDTCLADLTPAANADVVLVHCTM